MILHERGTNNINFLVIEFKTWWDSNQMDDMRKIEAFCDQSGEYGYKYGVIILLGKKRDEVLVKLYNENKWEEMK